MSQNQTPNITKEELNEYFIKKENCNRLKKEVDLLSKKIKYEMQKVGRKEITLHGYKIDIETKYEPTFEFFELLINNELSYLISKGITPTHFKTAIRKLRLSEDKVNTYIKEKETKWLHVNKN